MVFKPTPEIIAKAQESRRNRKTNLGKKYKKHIDILYKTTPANYHVVVKKQAEGNAKAAIKLKCLDCTCYQQEEIRNCPMLECSLYMLRPYQPKNK